MKNKPLAFVALGCVAAMVTVESAVLFKQIDRATIPWRNQWHTSLARVEAGQITTGLVRVLVRAAQ